MIEMKQCHGGVFSPGEPGSLRGIDLRLPNGRIYGLLGGAGSGKSACLRLFSGAVLPSTGEVRVNGFDTRREGRRVRSLVGYCPAGGGAHPDLSVREYLSFCSEVRGESPERGLRHIEELLELTSLKEKAHRLLSALSEGERRLCELAAASLGRVEMLALDDPFSGLTSLAAERVEAMIRTLSEGRTVLLSGRRPEQLSAICEELLLFDSGALVGRFEAKDPALGEAFRALKSTAAKVTPAPRKPSGRLGLLTEKSSGGYEEIDTDARVGEEED